MKKRNAFIQKLLAVGLTLGACHGYSAVEFSTNDPGQAPKLNLWALGWIGDTGKAINRAGGAQNIDIVRIGCAKEWALENDALVVDAMAEIDRQMAKAVKVREEGNSLVEFAIVCNPGTTKSTNSWYTRNNNTEIRENRWLKLVRAQKRYVENTYGMVMRYYEILNEHDFGSKIGNKTSSAKLLEFFQNDSEFGSFPHVGPSTLSSGPAKSWYDATKQHIDWGATHQINGSGEKYIDFVKQVCADGKPYWGSEIHHLAEMIIAEEYCGIGGSWWNGLSVVRGQFIQYSAGNRICYSEKAKSTSAASCYRDVDDPNVIHIFAVSSGGAKDGGGNI